MNPNDTKAALDAIQQALTSFTASLQALAAASGNLNPQMSPIIQQVIADLAKGIASVAQASATLGNAAASATKATGAFASLDKWLGTLGSSAIKAQIGLSIAIHGIERAFNSLGNQFTKFVQLASPATVILFNRAMDNLMSAFGQILTPVLQKLTPIVQALANAIVSLDEPSKKLLATLAVGSAIAGVVAGIAAAVSAVVSVLGGWVTALIALGSTLAGAVVMSSEFSEVAKTLSGILKVIGNAFQTIAKPILGIVNALATVFAGLVESLTPVIDAITDFAGVVVDALSVPINIAIGVLKAFMPVITQVAKVVSLIVRMFSSLYEAIAKLAGGLLQKLADLMAGPITEAVGAMVSALTWLVDQLTAAVNRIRRLLGLGALNEGRFDPNEKRAQAVVKNASIGDVQSFLNKAYTSAATGNGLTIQQAQLNKLADIDSKMGGLAKGIGGEVGQAIRDHFPRPDNRGNPGKAAGGAIGNAFRPGENRPAPLPVPPLPSAPLPGPARGLPGAIAGGIWGGPFGGIGIISGIWSGWRKAFN